MSTVSQASFENGRTKREREREKENRETYKWFMTGMSSHMDLQVGLLRKGLSTSGDITFVAFLTLGTTSRHLRRVSCHGRTRIQIMTGRGGRSGPGPGPTDAGRRCGRSGRAGPGLDLTDEGVNVGGEGWFRG